jgi:hypothetical protein
MTETIEQKLQFLTTQELERYRNICQRQYVLSPQDRCFGLMRDYLAREYQRRTEQ